MLVITSLFTEHELRCSDALGLVTTWSVEFGYVSIHDPTTGEWHDLLTKEAPRWAVGEAHRRKNLYKRGDRKAYRLTSLEMEKIWEVERAKEPASSPGIPERGIVYEDYLEGSAPCITLNTWRTALSPGRTDL